MANIALGKEGHKVGQRATYEQFDFCGIQLSAGSNDDFGKILFTEKQNSQLRPHMYIRIHSLPFLGCLHRSVMTYGDSGSLLNVFWSARCFCHTLFLFIPIICNSILVDV